MFRLAFYITKRFVLIWLGVVFGFLILIGLLDSLANGGDIVGEDGGFVDTFRYMFYRAPVIFDRIFVFTFVVAILLTFVGLIRNHELVALLGFGISVPKQILMLVPAVFLCGLASIAIIDGAMPPAVRALQAWGVAEYKQRNVTEANPLWLEDERRIVRAAGRPGYASLRDLEFYARTDTGAIKTVTFADTARFIGSGWELDGVRTLEVAGADGETREVVTQSGPSVWTTQQTPDTIARLAAEPRDISLSDMSSFSRDGNSGSRPSFAYRFWFLHRITRPLAILVLLACSVAIMQRVGRQDTGDRALIVGIAAGFLFLILDGAMATFTASGAIAPALGIAFPIVIFGLIAGLLISRTEAL